MRKTLSLILCLIMLLSMGCALAESDYSEHMTISGAWTLYYGGDVNNDPLTQWWGDKFNIDWEIVTADSEKCRIWINSGDVPDVMIWDYSHVEAANYVDQELFYRFPDDWKERWPNVAEWYSYTGLGDYTEELFGGTYMIPRAIFTTALEGVSPVLWHYDMFIRTDWLKAIGIEPQTTYTVPELISIAEKIKEEDPGKIGSSLVPICVDTSYAYRLFVRSNYEKANKFYKDENGEYKWGAADPETLEALKLYQEAYKKGLIPTEFFTLSSTDAREYVTNLGVGAMFMGGATASLHQSRTYEMMSKLGISGDDIQIVPALGADGKYHDVEVENWGSVVVFDPDISEEKFARIMDMMDYACSPEGQILINCGFEGVDWEYDEEGNIVPLNTIPMKEKYPSQDPLYCNMCFMADNFSLLNPTIAEQYRLDTINDYQLKAELSDESTVYHIDWDLLFYDSNAMQKATFNYDNEFAQLIVKDGDLAENWQAWVDSKMTLVQRVLDELNALDD